MATVSEQLRGLFSSEQLSSLDKVRQVMTDDPTVFDNHSRELRPSGQENSDGKKV